MTVKMSHQGFVCTDCLMVIANGDTSGIDDVTAWESRVLEKNATEDGRYQVVPGTDTCGHFSRMGCDYCGSRLAGDVHLVTFLMHDNQIGE
jgi:hypothetical protein